MMVSTKHIAKIAVIAASLLTACKTTASSEPQRAVLTHTDQAVQESLTAAISKALGAKVTLAPDSFMSKSSVTIEPASVNKRNGQIIDGRSQDMPTQIDLMMMGKNCYVVNRGTGQKYKVEGLSCKPLV